MLNSVDVQTCTGFRCNNGQCIDFSERCNAQYDCYDKSDETFCGNVSTRDDYIVLFLLYRLPYLKVLRLSFPCFIFTEDYECAFGYEKCNSGQCIPKHWWCDYVTDCPDGSDERQCPNYKKYCDTDEFVCDNGQCIAIEYRCLLTSDTRKGCADKSNLKNCTNWVCDDDQVKCANSYCVHISLRCDGNVDCPKMSDWADELGCRKYIFFTSL